MHELSIAMSIIDMAEEESRQHQGQIVAIHVRLGRLSGVVAESLLSSFSIACEGTPLEGSSLVIEDVPIVVFCPSCRQQRVIPSMQSLCCPSCRTPTNEVLRGRELQVTALEFN